MRLKDKLRTVFQYLAFAFYPATTLIICGISTAIIVVILGFVMTGIPSDSAAYNIIFTLTTGAVASFFVTIVVELSGNYRHNKLGMYELADYYSIFWSNKIEKQIRMGKTISQRAERLAQEDSGISEEDPFSEDHNKDDIAATWLTLPKIIPVLKDTYENKKEFLSDVELKSLSRLMAEWDSIRTTAKMVLQYSLTAINRPDTEVLKNIYPRNILDIMSEATKEELATTESEKTFDTFVDAVLFGEALLQEYFGDYEISEEGLKLVSDDEDPEDAEDLAEESIDTEELTDEDIQALIKAGHKSFIEEMKPVVSLRISRCCQEISHEIENLERAVKKKPYYSTILLYMQKMDKYTDEKIRKDDSYKYEIEYLKKANDGDSK